MSCVGGHPCRRRHRRKVMVAREGQIFGRRFCVACRPTQALAHTNDCPRRWPLRAWKPLNRQVGCCHTKHRDRPPPSLVDDAVAIAECRRTRNSWGNYGHAQSQLCYRRSSRSRRSSRFFSFIASAGAGAACKTVGAALQFDERFGASGSAKSEAGSASEADTHRRNN
jgi:hypothetical protein